MAMSGGKDDGSPMMEMNTTPLIDVMLVLLIMFIITIPVATHAVNIDLPQSTPPTDQVVVNPIKNKVVLTQTDEILWNGTPLSQGQLLNVIQQSLALPVEPELQFQPEEFASYELSAQVLKIINGSGATKFGFVGNEQFREFGAGPAGVNPTTHTE
ncbi:ExbD/TolR family protein [Croceicoccus naphthovorans]|uniref:Biopolymer transporter ExbD n=1 Tax=Croceicoccus naphthovorans TaxID=1348774 RepID=A0A0G3XI28_9SPHN|nr:biopolymer transporter ExbD [Croceicoccus naphthovorans]AKM10857.1 biopolymer transporter ExbD [Croceicoccus naphthovorans]MBB3989083.1 biopolymer transport protein ExbD [Croceicoccus naphthovorans]